jgi:hypothetical protein
MFTTQALKRGFALSNGRTLTRHIQDRVMSTPTWPVPYWNRQGRVTPVMERKRDEDITNNGRPINWLDVHDARAGLKMSVKGRESLEYMENHAKITDFVVWQKDSGSMAKAYAADLVNYLDVANKENKRILGKTNLL